MWTILRRMFARKYSGQARDFGKRTRPYLELLEDRLVPTTTLWLDFGDNFPAHSTSVPGGPITTEFHLDMTVRQLRDTLSGPDLASSFTGSLLNSDNVRFTPFAEEVQFDYDGNGMVNGNDADQLRSAVISLVQRYYEPFDIDVVDVAATPAGGARNLADVTTRLASASGTTPGQNHAYLFVTGARSLAAARSIPVTLYGLAPLFDISGGSNSRDDTAVVFVNNMFARGYANQTADTALALTIAHEAGHTFGLKHTINGSGTTDAELLSRSDLMTQAADVGQEQELTSFPRFPLALVGSGTQNAYAELAGDPDIGARAGARVYVTGSGTHDIITLTRLSDTRATVQVQAFRNPNFTSPIPIPGSAGATTFTYTVNTTNGILVDAGFGNDRISVDARILRNIHVRGMAGVDELVVRGQPTMSNNYYEPDAETPAALDGSTSYGGRIVTGHDAAFLPPRPTITFEEFEPASSVRATGYIHFTFASPREHWDNLTISSPAALQERVDGFGFNADRSRTVTYVPLITTDVPNVYVETNTLPDVITVLGTSAATTISTGEGSDWIDVGTASTQLDGIRAPVTVLGGLGGAELWLHDYGVPTAGHIYTVTDTRVARDGIADIVYDNQVTHMRLNASWGNDTVNVRSTSAATPVTVSLKAGGADTVNVGSAGNTLDSIQGAVTVLGLVGSDGSTYSRLNINDQGASSANTYTHSVEYTPESVFYRGRVERSGAALITYGGGLAELVLNAGQNSDTINVHSTAALAPVTVNAGGGDDTMNVGFKSSVAGIQGRLHVNGQSGKDTLMVDDRADSASSLFLDFVGRNVQQNKRTLLTYDDVETILLLD